MSEDCQLPEYKACCCTCKYHATVNRHCSVDRKTDEGCVCGEVKGYACLLQAVVTEGRKPCVFDGWGEHGMCEMHEAIEGRKE